MLRSPTVSCLSDRINQWRRVSQFVQQPFDAIGNLLGACAVKAKNSFAEVIKDRYWRDCDRNLSRETEPNGGAR